MMIGRRIGRYRVLAALGKGGMATVWRVRDELLGRDVALKLLNDELSQSPQARRRFRHEARVAAALDHPGVAAVYESGESDGATYITMALIEGETVAERLERSLLPMDEALRVAANVAEALGYAHAREVVHRDVTSRNVMLARDGRVLVLDFGLALAAGVSRVSSSTTTMGTVAYMSPEVLLGREADARSDLYGLGVVLYEMLTGRTPFTGERREALAFAALNQDPTPPSALRAEVPAGLDRIVLRLLARDPEDRYPDAGTLLADLGEWAKRGPSVAVPEGAAEAHVAPPAGSADLLPTRSIAADLIASGTGPVYVVLAPFEIRDAGAHGAAMTALAKDLTEALCAGVTRLGRVHLVIPSGRPAEGESSGAFAARSGAHAALTATLRVSGSSVRAVWRLVDADRGAQIAGGTVSAALGDECHLEEQLVTDVASKLSPRSEPIVEGWQSAARDPAASEHFEQALRYLHRFDDPAAVDGAIAILERLMRASPKDGAIRATLGRAYLAKRALTEQHVWEGRAATAIEAAARLAPEAPEVHVALGEMHLAGTRPERALEEFRIALAAREDDHDALIGIARAELAVGRWHEAEAACQRVIARRPTDWRGYHELGLVLFKSGDLPRATEAWRRALELAPDNARAASNLGSAYFRMDRFEEAIRAYRLSLELHPSSWGYTNLGTALFYEKRYPEAVEAFERAVSLTPSDPLMWGNLGDARRLIPGLEGAAAEAHERAAGLMHERLWREPGDANGWARLSGWLVALGRGSDAVAAVRRAMEIAPHDAAVLASAGHTLLLAGDRSAALDALEAAVRHGFGVDALRRSEELAALASDPRFQRVLSDGPPKVRVPVVRNPGGVR